MVRYCPICLREAAEEWKNGERNSRLREMKLKRKFFFPLLRLVYVCPRCGRMYVSSRANVRSLNRKGYAISTPLAGKRIRGKILLITKMPNI